MKLPPAVAVLHPSSMVSGRSEADMCASLGVSALFSHRMPPQLSLAASLSSPEHGCLTGQAGEPVFSPRLFKFPLGCVSEWWFSGFFLSQNHFYTPKNY